MFFAVIRTIFFILLIFAPSIELKAQSFVDDSGILNLSESDFSKEGRVDLNEGWEFYWKELIEPGEFGNFEPTKIIAIGSWVDEEKRITSKGYGTYRLRIHQLDSLSYMALLFSDIYSSYKVWINGSLRQEMGTVSSSSETVVHRNLPSTIPFEQEDGTIEIVVQVANFYHQKGGLSVAPVLGSSKTLLRRERIAITADMLFIGSFGFVGLSYLMLFLFFWRKDKAILYFSLFCFLWAYRTLSDNYAPLSFLFPAIEWAFYVRLEYMSLFLGGFMASLFMAKVFPRYIHKSYSKWMTYGMILFATLTMVLPTHYFTSMLLPFFALMGVNIVYVFLVIIEAAIGRQRESILALLSVVLTTIVLVSHVFSFFQAENEGLIYINIGYMLVFLVMSMLLGMRFTNSFHKLEKMQEQTLDQKEEILSQSDQLLEINAQLSSQSLALQERNTEIEEINKHLEKTVERRTQRLENANMELDTFLYRSSHDLMRPIKTIEGLIDLSNHATSIQEFQQLFDYLKDCTYKMDALLAKLNNIHEIKNHTIHIKKINMDDFFDRVKGEILKSVSNSDRVSFKLIYPQTLEGDHYMLSELIIQLFKNSAVWADFSSDDLIINCRIDSKRFGTTILVYDNGPGIPKHLTEGVFEMYKVVNNQTNTHGLGLFMVNKIVEKFKGHVRLTSFNNKGVKVRITLPKQSLA